MDHLRKQLDSVKEQAEQVDQRTAEQNNALALQLERIESKIAVFGQVNQRLDSLLSRLGSGPVSQLSGRLELLEQRVEAQTARLNDGLQHNQQSLDELAAGLGSVTEQQQALETLAARLEVQFTAAAQAGAAPSQDVEQALNELRASLVEVRQELHDVAQSAPSTSDLDVVRQQAALSTSELDALQAVATRDELDEAVGLLREQVDAAHKELQGSMDSAPLVEEIQAVRARVELATSELEAVRTAATQDQVNHLANTLRAELTGGLDELRSRLDSAPWDEALEDAKQVLRSEVQVQGEELRDQIEVRAEKGEVVQLRDKMSATTADVQVLREAARSTELAFAVNNLRDDLSAMRAELEAAVEQKATSRELHSTRELLSRTAGEVEILKQDAATTSAFSAELDQLQGRLSAAEAGLNAATNAVGRDDLDEALDGLRQEVSAAVMELREVLPGAADEKLDELRQRMKRTTNEVAALKGAVTRDDLAMAVSKLRGEMSATSTELERALAAGASSVDLSAFRQQLEITLNEMEFLKGDVHTMRDQLAGHLGEAPSIEQEEPQDANLGDVQRRVVGLAMDLSSSTVEFQRQLDAVQERMERMDEDLSQPPASAELEVDPGQPMTDVRMTAELQRLRREVEKIVAAFAKKSEVNTAIKETNSAFRKIVQDFDRKLVDLRNRLSTEAETRHTRMADQVAESVTRAQHSLNEFQSQVEAAQQAEKEVKEIKQQLVLTQNAIMELNVLVEQRVGQRPGHDAG